MTTGAFPRVKCRLTFLPGARDRRHPALQRLADGTYRPYVLVESIAAPVDRDLLGVAFVAGPPNPGAGKAVPAEFVCLHDPVVDYSGLTPGTRFRVVEGNLVVAEGEVEESPFRPGLARAARR